LGRPATAAPAAPAAIPARVTPVPRLPGPVLADHAATNGATNGSSAEDAGPPVRKGRNPLDHSPLEGAKVLVVDDDFRNIFALSALLERGHAEVVVAENGLDAITALERMSDIDIVLMDIMMPGMDGYETMRAIRLVERFASLPIIAVTGKVVQGERERCIEAGANDYVTKPVDTAELLESVGPWLAARAPSAP
jgi:CheY-like chemotaxis protein